MSRYWARIALVLWTVGIWGSRVRNIVVDDDLTGADRLVSFGVALTLLAAALAVAAAIWLDSHWLRAALGVLVIAGIARWTIRGPIILLSDEWEIGFKVVHTVLWLVTVVLSVGAWREQSRSDGQRAPIAAEAQ